MPQYAREVNAAVPSPPGVQGAPLPKVPSPTQPRIVPYSEPQPLPSPNKQTIQEPPITVVRHQGVELGPIKVVPIEAQVIVERKGQYPHDRESPERWEEFYIIISPFSIFN